MNEENKTLYDTSITENDSILDFKSPKQFSKTKLTEFNYFNGHQKKKTNIKFKNVIKSQRDNKKKKEQEKKRNLQESQSLESSFFKFENNCDNNSNNDVKVALVCPLCFKTFKDLNSRALHMKICAYKNNISTKKLLDAIELQKRQEDERKSLGLLVAPIVQDKKKSMLYKISYEETDFQLALALSKSLQEAEELDKINEIEKLPKVLNQFILEENKSESQLEKFGFINSKPPSLIKNKKRKNNEITLLQTRSEKERNHILTERISEILMGDELITQNQKEKIKCNYIIEKKTDLKSHLLQELLNKEKKLWNKAKLPLNQNNFYVSNLSQYITLEEKQREEEMILDFANTCDVYNHVKSNQNPTEFNNEKIYEISHKKIYCVNEKCENCQNMQFINTVITNWGDSLNDSSASDIIIFVKNDKHIWAHKLVLHIQCSNMLLDITSNDTLLFTNIKEKISWTDVSYNIALAFLEFIYCGIIEKYSNILNDLKNYPFLRDLARKYKVKELFVFLEKRQIKIKSQMDSKEQECISKKKDNLKLTNDEILNLINEIKDHKFNDDKKLNKKCLEKYIIDKSKFEIKLKNDKCTDELSKKIVNCLNDTNAIQNSNMSPDLFDDTIQTKKIKNKKARYINKIIDSEKIKNNENSSIFDSVNQLFINTINSSTSENTEMFKNTKENINLLPNIQCFSTPNNNNCNIQKLKSNLSLFIEQIQRENADLDVDSEDSILSTNYKICRNPFNIRQNNSSEYCISQINTITEKKYKAKKDILIDTSDYDKNSKVDIKIHEKDDANMFFNHELVDNVINSSESNIEKYKNNSLNENINNICNLEKIISELDDEDLNIYTYEKSKKNKNIPYTENSKDNSQIFENDVYLANVYIDNSDDNINTSLFTKEINQLEQFQNRKTLLTTKKCNRKFQKKSRSETSLYINTKDIKNNITYNKSYNNFQVCTCNHKKETTTHEIIRDSVTPPPNYNDMKTTELQAELNKYGLKIQKRKRAIKLLTYIYDELHPTICTSKSVESKVVISTSEDDEPPMKKIYNRKDIDCIDNYDYQLGLSQEYTNKQLSLNIIDKEKQLDESEFISIIDNTNIKDMFLKILSVKTELYNKILMYEPICINTLYSMLKAEGFKCKMNTLMKFLDEQCITFYV
ncbi:protein PFC0760c-like [Apis laboriosa]|uniref:protein PFC0760c-like n=1 Tax=Apis laboriosa TaxID=183418 RepID=UPI001CC6BABF|nr:protein PFC0760c-like [Apis laboriosa]